jgi:hypothetical protein
MATRREPIFNWPIVICLIALAIVIWPVKWFATNLFVWFDFWNASIIGLVVIAIGIAAAFAYDHLQARRSRQLQRPERNDFRSPER